MDLADRTGFTDGWRGDVGQAAWNLRLPPSGTLQAFDVGEACADRVATIALGPRVADLLCPMPIGPRPRWGGSMRRRCWSGSPDATSRWTSSRSTCPAKPPPSSWGRCLGSGDHGRRSHRRTRSARRRRGAAAARGGRVIAGRAAAGRPPGTEIARRSSGRLVSARVDPWGTAPTRRAPRPSLGRRPRPGRPRPRAAAPRCPTRRSARPTPARSRR